MYLLSNNVADTQKNTEECLLHGKQQEKANGEGVPGNRALLTGADKGPT